MLLIKERIIVVSCSVCGWTRNYEYTVDIPVACPACKNPERYEYKNSKDAS